MNDRDRTIQWIRAVLNALQEVDEKKGIELLHACGRACSKGSALLEGAERIRKEHGERGDVDSLFEAFKSEYCDTPRLVKEGNAITLVFESCTCPMVRRDAVAGITVAVVLVPQAMAYAMLAGLPPVYGLYAASVAPWIGALWGSLRQLATGPIAIMSLLVLTTLTPMAEPGSERYVEMAVLLAHLVGLLYLVVGGFRMGLIMSFISHSAVKGFTAAASLIITATQLPHRWVWRWDGTSTSCPCSWRSRKGWSPFTRRRPPSGSFPLGSSTA